MRHNTIRLKDLTVGLKELEPVVKQPKLLRSGRPFGNFPMRPRELLANWLICAVGDFENETLDLTIAASPEEVVSRLTVFDVGASEVIEGWQLRSVSPSAA
jgi:hypothetical protein